MQDLQPGQIVQVNDKDATVISVGEGIVHLEQGGEAISVHPGEVFIRGAVEAPDELPREESSAIFAEIVALKQRVTALETQANRIEKALAALTAGPTKSLDDKPVESAAPAGTTQQSNSEATDDAAASASE